ncbi:MAG: metallophosphoesterase [Planctomycetes bacterium]|nr:metallophosphoesterase [Planctomycetota bacterium]
MALSILSLPFLPGCAGNRPAHPLPIRIGLLADSQITSPDSTPDCLYRSKALDKSIECAIRPPALEHLTAEMLQIALNRFPADIDVILYLGDGANSGGENELQTLFTALEEHRNRTKIPIFMVIGNHDYLGSGSTSDPLMRFLLVNRLRPQEVPPLPATYHRCLSKFDVLKRISAFNRASRDMPTNALFRYTDNGDTLDPNLDHGSGLYLAGRLVYPKDGEGLGVPNAEFRVGEPLPPAKRSRWGPDKTVEIFLADTSDYVDTSIKPEVNILEPFIPQWGLYGMQGSVSSRDRAGAPGGPTSSQITYLRDRSAGPPPEYRFVASHYPPDNLDRKRSDIPTSWHFELLNLLHGAWETIETVVLGSPYANQHLPDWCIEGKANYWLSGHTHRTTMLHPGQSQAHVGGLAWLWTGASFHNINVGSTTDYRAHIAVVEPFSKPQAHSDRHVKKVDRYVQFREIPLFDPEEPRDRQYLERVLRDIEAYGRRNRSTAHGIGYQSDAQFGLSLLGLNKDYQDDHWTPADTEVCCRRLDRFIEAVLSQHPDDERADIVRCLAFVASACEAGAGRGRNGFDPNRCRLP